MAISNQRTLGFIINPVAGLGGRVGLKGSDGLIIQQQARDLGAIPEVFDRAAAALRALRMVADDPVRLMTYPGEMGENVAIRCGFSPVVIGDISEGMTTAENTREAAQEMHKQGVDLIMFAGGDGTARDIYEAVGDSVPTIGIPAGVKIHSAVFGVNPSSAGKLAAQYLGDEIHTFRNAEVMDIDEDLYREGTVSPRLYGYLRIPFQKRLVQSRKSPNPVSEEATLQAIALDVIDHMDDKYYIIGPGTTTKPIFTRLGLKKTLIGVDVIQKRELVISDANEKSLLELLEHNAAKIVVTPIGGQGFIFGRGNQQISPKVLGMVGLDNIIVVSVPEKIHLLGGRPLLVDTGSPEIDQALSRHIKVITGYGESIIYPVKGGIMI
jgi:predicted polyphosphate/ATP-dependent NAD kinase